MRSDHALIPAQPYRSYADYRDGRRVCAVGKARSLSPAEVIEEVKRAGLRGRGGAGFPTGVKWASVASQACPTRHVVCNAAEGEPGTFKDRHLLRRNPYAVIEGMLIAAHAVGAQSGVFAAKASFTRELERFRRALEEMRAAGVLGDFALELFEGPEEYLFGEEKALLNAIEGEGPLPRPPGYPPYEFGLHATAASPNPAVVNNAETFARVSTILREGAASFRSLGTADTPGPLLITLSGDLVRPGMYELEAGLTLRTLLFDVGGGPLPGRRFKAILSGVSNAVLLPEKFDTPVDFGSLALLGSGLGSAGFIVYDDRRNLARVAQMIARFLYVESCNQCWACKEGLRLASGALDELFGNTAAGDAPERALIGALHAPQGNRCYLPVEGSILIPSLIERFRGEFDALAAQPADASEEIPFPKIVDFDETARTFTYDAYQKYKQPDWTFRVPAQPAPKPTAKPARSPSGETSTSVRLSADLAARLRELAAARGRDLHGEVDEALREWLKKRGG